MTESLRKNIARLLLVSAGQGDIATVEPLIAPDFILEQMVRDGDAATAPAGTRYDRANYLGFLAAVAEMTRSGMNLSIDLVVEEGAHVVAFGTSDALTPSGWIYRNAYCWHLEFTDGKVSLMREYFDTALGQQLLLG